MSFQKHKVLKHILKGNISNPLEFPKLTLRILKFKKKLSSIKIIKPKVIVTLGNPSTRFILNTNEGITNMRGKWSIYKGIPVMPTYHPSYILRNGGDSSNAQKQMWSDMLEVLKKLGKTPKVNIKWK